MFSAFSANIVITLLLNVRFLEDSVQAVLCYGEGSPEVLGDYLCALLVLLADLCSVITKTVLRPRPMPICRLVPNFRCKICNFSFSFVLLTITYLCHGALPFILLNCTVVCIVNMLVPLLECMISVVSCFAHAEM